MGKSFSKTFIYFHFYTEMKVQKTLNFYVHIERNLI